MRIFVLFLVFLVSIVSVTAIPHNTQYSENGDAHMTLSVEKPVVVKSTGDNALFTYDFRQYAGSWIVDVCPKQYDRDIKNNNGLKNRLKNTPITAIAGQVKGHPPKVDLSDNVCVHVPFEAKEGDSFKIGSQSTIINVTNGTVNFIITPENVSCTGLVCESEIIIENNDAGTFVFGTENLVVTPTQEAVISYWYAGNEITYPLDISVSEGDSAIIHVVATFQEIFEVIKYNVSLSYAHNTYVIDPFFIYSNNTVDDVILSALTQDSFVAAWCDEANDDINMRFFNTSNIPLSNTILVDNSVGSCHNEGTNVDVARIHDTGAVIIWNDHDNPNTVKMATYNTSGTLLDSITVDSDAGNDATGVSVEMLNTTHLVVAWIDKMDSRQVIKRKLFLNNLSAAGLEINVSNSDVGSSYDVTLSKFNETTYFLSWYDASTTSIKFDVMRENTVIVDDSTLDNSVGGYGEIDSSQVNNTHIFFAWKDQSSADYAILNADGQFSLTQQTITAIGSNQKVESATLNETTFAVAFTDASPVGTYVVIVDNEGNTLFGEKRYSPSASYKGVSVLSQSQDAGICDDNLVLAYGGSSAQLSTNYTNLSAWGGNCFSACTENWTLSDQTCTGLQYVKIYEDQNACGTTNFLPLDNGTITACDIFTCQANNNITFERNMEWYCRLPNTTTPNTYSCTSHITQGTEFISTFPHPVFIEDVGQVNSFQEKNRQVNVRFTTENLKRGQTYNFSVSCYSGNSSVSDETFMLETTPKDVLFTDWGIGRSIWVVQNMVFITGAFILSVIALWLFFMYKRVSA